MREISRESTLSILTRGPLKASHSNHQTSFNCQGAWLKVAGVLVFENQCNSQILLETDLQTVTVFPQKQSIDVKTFPSHNPQGRSRNALQTVKGALQDVWRWSASEDLSNAVILLGTYTWKIVFTATLGQDPTKPSIYTPEWKPLCVQKLPFHLVGSSLVFWGWLACGKCPASPILPQTDHFRWKT